MAGGQRPGRHLAPDPKYFHVLSIRTSRALHLGNVGWSISTWLAARITCWRPFPTSPKHAMLYALLRLERQTELRICRKCVAKSFAWVAVLLCDTCDDVECLRHMPPRKVARLDFIFTDGNLSCPCHVLTSFESKRPDCWNWFVFRVGGVSHHKSCGFELQHLQSLSGAKTCCDTKTLAFEF